MFSAEVAFCMPASWQSLHSTSPGDNFPGECRAVECALMLTFGLLVLERSALLADDILQSLRKTVFLPNGVFAIPGACMTVHS